MTTVQITLPDQLAQEAQRAGLLSPEFVEKWLREQLKAQRADQLFSAMDRMSSVDEPTIMSPEAVAEEIAAMRAERRAHNPR
jgi:Arc/MetJ family transcription regulator